jgi:SAM-dependent methyltransferase
MDHEDHVDLIRNGVLGAGRRWLELGAGEGAFTLALAELLGTGPEIEAVDRDAGALATLAAAMRTRFPNTTLRIHHLDFVRELPAGPFDGVLAANSLHFVRELASLLQDVHDVLTPGGRLLIVEYDADRGNPWVPHPFSFATWKRTAAAAGFGGTRLVGHVPSRFLGAMYGAVTFRPDS